MGGYRANIGRAKMALPFYYETVEKHPFLPGFKTSKLATDTHRHTRTFCPSDLLEQK